MPSVSNLKIQLQSGTDSTYYATWDFNESVKKTKGGPSTSTIKTSDWVTIKSGAKYYNGVTIPSWVMSDTWKVIQVSKGDRAVLGKNKSGTHDIQSAISTKYLTKGSSSSSSTSTKADTKDTTKYLDHYLVKWYYITDDGVQFIANENGSETKERQLTYNGPSNAKKIKVSVKPVSKTYTSNNKEVSYWTGTWVSATYNVASNPPEVPDKPSVTIEKLKLTLRNSDISDPRTDYIQYELVGSWYKKSSVFGSGGWSSADLAVNGALRRCEVPVRDCQTSVIYNISPGYTYQFRCRAVNKYGDLKLYSDWSQMTDIIKTVPPAPKYIKALKALSETSVQVSWNAVNTATGYEVEYTTKKIYFDSASSEVKSVTVTDAVTYAIVTSMTSGEEYFFRLRATNSEGESEWSEISSIVIGEAPSAPTTWSSTTTAIVGESVTLYWVHNSKDSSNMKLATLELYFNDSTTPAVYAFTDSSPTDDGTIVYIPLTEEERENGKTESCILKTTPNTAVPDLADKFVEGASIKWRIRTAGITKDYGEWSIQREITINASPTLEFSITDADGATLDTVTSFPFYINALAGPNTQMPVGYYVNISSDEQYETVDNMGNPKLVNVGDSVYSKYFDISDPLVLKMTPDVISLENNISYTASCIVSMNSGLTAEETVSFTTSWTAVSYEPDVEVGIDTDAYAAYLSPYCFDAEGNNITDVSLSVYRREFDGSFTEIATGIETDANEYIVDPHPSLDYARYRIIATSKTTGSISYYDPPGQPVGGKEAVIQWDEDWTNFDTNDEAELESPPWSGSMLKLPYNIDVSESTNLDVSLIEYIGRKHPVTYYGTQIGSGATWNLQVPKNDKDTLYGLRRLSRWMGDVYVREPSGSGYWANITVSFNQKHCELTIPVTLSISQVEGGM